MAPIPQDAVFATLLMTDSYLPGAMVLGHSLRDRGAKAKLVALVVLNRLAPETVTELQTVYDDIVPVQQISNSAPANLYLMNRPDLISTFTKIELWRQTQYRRIVYLDADMVTVRCPNELLVLDTKFAAVPDVGWPDCFNSGLMVLNPNMGDYYSLLALARRGISFDGADQGLLNMHFTDWEKLSFAYNCTPSANYQYVPAYKHFQSSISMIHFIGAEKPWHLGRDSNHDRGVFGELLARWWAVYDRHYRRPKSTFTPGQFVQTSKSVQDYVRGEETIYEPVYQTFSSNQQMPIPPPQQHQSQPASIPGVHTSAPLQERRGSMERPFGDQPSQAEKISHESYEPTSTAEQRRWSAPHAEWEPTRQPPPPNSKPEAANFPTQQYEMSHSTQLFEPPAAYPEPPRDMWYKVPERTQPESNRTIFPWEQRAPKATRVFPRSREPSPPPVAAQSDPSTDSQQGPTLGSPLRFTHQSTSLSSAATAPKPPSPPHHVFPWESRAPKATRVFPPAEPPPPPPIVDPQPETRSEREPSVTTDVTDPTVESAATPRAPENPWDTFSQRPNVWDDMPEISKYMEQINKPKRGKIQVLHHTPSQSISLIGESKLSPKQDRRSSLLITDFPTQEERPSLPVTPAPIRRPTFWGEEKDDLGFLPGADGVPKPEQWNPIMRLEELQRRQSELLTEGASDVLAASITPPKREMPGSHTREAVEEAVEKKLHTRTDMAIHPPKPILREPRFEVTDLKDEDLQDEEKTPTPQRTSPTQTRSPTRFSPFVMEGEAASEKSGIEDDTLSPTSAADNTSLRPGTSSVVV